MKSKNYNKSQKQTWQPYQLSNRQISSAVMKYVEKELGFTVNRKKGFDTSVAQGVLISN